MLVSVTFEGRKPESKQNSTGRKRIPNPRKKRPLQLEAGPENPWTKFLERKARKRAYRWYKDLRNLCDVSEESFFNGKLNTIAVGADCFGTGSPLHVLKALDVPFSRRFASDNDTQ